MIKTNLSSGEIQDLINKYNSELKKLEFQIAEVKMTLSGLENLMKDVNSREKASFAKVKIKKEPSVEKVKKGRKSSEKKLREAEVKKSNKTAAKKATGANTVKAAIKKKAVAKPVKKKTTIGKATVKGKAASIDKKGYKLSDWDNYVIQSIEQSGKVLITSEIIDLVKSKMTDSGKKTTDAEVKNKVTRSLQKLVNRRGDLSKVTFKGKGFAYSLPNWVVSKGKVAAEFNR